MKNYPIVCPPLKIPSPHSHMSIYERHSCFRKVRITKGTIAESKNLRPTARQFFNMQNTTSYSHIYQELDIHR